MKKLTTTQYIWIAIIVMLAFCAFIFIDANRAEAAEISVRTYNTIPTDAEQIVQNGYGVQTNFHIGPAYFYLSADKNPVRFGGQKGQDVILGSAGVGFEYMIGSKVKIAGDLGWYEPFHDSDKQTWRDGPLTEGLHYHLTNKLGMRPIYPSYDIDGHFNWYSIDYNGAIGAKIGLEFVHTFTNGWSLSAGAHHRLLRLGEMIKGGSSVHPMWWELKENRDFGATQVGLMFKIPI